MDYWEELTTSQADLLLANSEFTAKVFLVHFPSTGPVLFLLHGGFTKTISGTENASFEAAC